MSVGPKDRFRGLGLPQPSRRQTLWQLLDIMIAISCFVVGWLTWNLPSLPSASSRPPRDAAAILLLAASTLPFAVRRRLPVPVAIISTLGVAILWSRGYYSAVHPNLLIINLYTVSAHRPPRSILFCVSVYTTCVGLMFLTHAPGFGSVDLIASVAAMSAAVGVGWSAQTRVRLGEAVAQQVADASARAISEERLQIAREVHDIVAHSIGAIAVQAGAGLHLLDTNPAGARQALTNISRTSRTSLAEMRTLVGGLREPNGSALEFPMPGIGDLPRLVTEADLSCLKVDLDLRVNHHIPRGIGLAVYRIVQESLTNAVRHGAATSAVVTVTTDGRYLTVEIVDDGSGPHNKRTEGNGLLGMQERVGMHGGNISVGPGRCGGFQVVAKLPHSESTPL